MATRGQQELRRQIASHEREAELLRANPPAAEAAERERQAAEHDRQAAILRDNLEADLQAERAALVQARDTDLVRVRWLRDGPPEGCLIDGRVYAGRGPVRQRQGQSATHTSTVAREVVLAAGEEQTIPRQHAEVLAEAAYLELVQGEET